MNAATSILNHIGGTAAAMLRKEQEQKELREFLRKDAQEHPKEPRIAQPLRSYLKRYRNNLAEYMLRNKGK